jgi:mannose-1-phosphate guanylyltransferase
MVYAVIMAGGSGTRFWPKSTSEKPKQFLHLFGDGTMLQNTVERVADIIPLEQVYVVTNDRYVDTVADQLPGIPTENIIGECVARNTAPCVAISAAILENKDPDSVMVVLPADHHITRPGDFRTFLKTAIEKARTEDALVTIGIQPDKPETGYGYIQRSKEAGEDIEGNQVYKVEGFREKPDLETAQKFLDSGDFYWNSGMFIWKSSNVMKSIRKHLPDMHKVAMMAQSEGYTKEAIDHFYENAESISIDYGIMEKAKNVYVVPGEFGWNDVGSWSAAYDLSDKDEDGNSKSKNLLLKAGSKNNYLSLDTDKLVAMVGVENLALVETEKAILICDLSKAQDVKEIVEQLKSDEDLKKYL